MAKKSSVSGEIINTPKGGGALQGIGEKFSADLHTGTGNFTVPIALPTGRNGFQPELNLIYSTGNGNGPFGLGWSLSVPGVSRKTSKGIPRYQDQSDVFLLSGTEDLVPVKKKKNKTTYRPRTEGLFARIEHHHDDHNDYWKIQTKDGLVSIYGTPENGGSDPAAISDPSNREKIFAWKLTRTQDLFGNQIEYIHERDSGQDGPHHWDQLYLKQIRYGDYTLGNDIKFMVTVTFHYEERPDSFSEYQAGFEIRTRKRCSHIEVHTHADEQRLVRSYHLIYLDQRAELEELLPLNGVSLLNQIEVVGHDGDQYEKLPPLEFGYTCFEPQQRDFFPLEGMDLPPRSLADPNLDLVDLFGNGLPDVLEMNGKVRYWRNIGSGRFDLPREMRTAPAGLSLAEKGVQLIDADGDARTDLMVTTGNKAGYYPLCFGGLWDQQSFKSYDLAPSFNLEDPEVKLVDLNGDGITDAIRSGNRMECFFNHSDEGWNDTRWVERRSIEKFPNINFSDDRVKWADMSGDGLQDVVLVHDGNIEYWPNLGYGNWGKRISMRNNPRFPYGYNPKRILVGDVDGDGLADIVYVDDTRVLLWINRSGNAWSDPIEIQGTPPVSDMDAVRLADILGSGIRGVLWTRDTGTTSRPHYFFLDFTANLKPYLLNEMNNHMGAVTRVEYAPSTRFYLEDEKHPETSWKTPLPFPVQVVARVEVIDAISKGKLTTEYSYHHGYWDGSEREFRGFGRVDQRDTEVFERYHSHGLHAGRSFEHVDEEMFSPPVEIRTWFHQGPVGDQFAGWEEPDFSLEFWEDDPQVLSRPECIKNFLKTLPRRIKRDALRTLRGRVLRTELYALDGSELQGRPYTVTEYLYGVREEEPPDSQDQDRLHIFFPHALAQRTTQWERGYEPMTQITFTDDYNEYGQSCSQFNIAVPRGRDFRKEAQAGEPYLATYSEITYAHRNDDIYLVDRVARTNTYEIEGEVKPSVFELVTRIKGNKTQRKIIAQSLNFYDGPAREGLPFGKLGDYGAVTRTESLVLTEKILDEAYKSSDVVLAPPEKPPFMAPETPSSWPLEYPQKFRDLLPELAGYVFHAGDPNSEFTRGYFAVTGQRYDFHENQTAKGLLVATRDPLGRDTTIDYDDYNFLPVGVTDPAGLTMKATYDYRSMQPSEITDTNANRSAYSFTPLGLINSSAVMGKVGEDIGDTIDVPGTEFVYDFLAFLEREQPVSVRTTQRIHHVNDTDIPLPQRDETIEKIEYSDGFGRLLQLRTQAEDITFGDPIFGDAGLPADQSMPPGEAVGKKRSNVAPPRVTVSGWQTCDNKGQVVEKYEPFFSSGWDYEFPGEQERGKKVTIYYDPRGQIIHTINPDGSEQRIIYGIPEDLADPEHFIPTPWETYTYDPNDNAGRTHPGDTQDYLLHWDTPVSTKFDARGRTVETILCNGSDPSNWYTTRSTYDILDNLLTVTDALDRMAFNHVFDLANNTLRTESIDAGVRRTMFDAASNVIEKRDSKGALSLYSYDVLNRMIRLWAKDDTESTVTLRERMIYGDGADADLSVEEATSGNLLGRVFKHYDEAGLLNFSAYDFKGNILEKGRQVINDKTILSVFDPPPSDWKIKAFKVDWEPLGGITLEDHASTQLDLIDYRTSITYDALNRVKTMHYPKDVEGERKQLLPQYNRAGALEKVELDGVTYVEHIAYSAKGQRTLIAFGNGLMIRYAYNPQTFRLARIRTEKYSEPVPLTYSPSGAPLQDIAYQYDLVGNIIKILDRTPKSGIPNTPLGLDALDRSFSYDPLYRLISATGREHAVAPPDSPWIDNIKSQDHTLTRPYNENYQYDPVGNVTQLQHQANSDSFTRKFGHVSGNNWLASVTVGQRHFSYLYDVNGNLKKENNSRHFEWDHVDRMKTFRNQAGESEPSVHIHFLYDTGGQRVKKLIRKQGGQIEVTIYIGGIFEHHHLVRNSTIHQNNKLHVMDGKSRIAILRIGVPFAGDNGPAVTYHLGDYLDSSSLVIDDIGTWTNREEYTPYGETSFGSYSCKRYRFTGKERDKSSGLYYHEARYYAPWLARWISCDPTGAVDGVNLFQYTRSNPVNLVDLEGTNGEQPIRQGTTKVITSVDVNGVPKWHSEQSQTVIIALQKNITEYMLEHMTEEEIQELISENKGLERRAKELASRMKNTTKNISIETVKTGWELLRVLKRASKGGVIKNLIVFGHSGPSGLYMFDDRGFYKDDPWKGTLYENRYKIKPEAGARTISDLKQMMIKHEITFSEDAVAIFVSCASAGEKAPRDTAFAQQFTLASGVTSVASVGLTEPYGKPDYYQKALLYWVRLERKLEGRDIPYSIKPTRLPSILDPLVETREYQLMRVQPSVP